MTHAKHPRAGHPNLSESDEWPKKLFELLSVIPGDQTLVTAGPDTAVRDALGLLDKHGFSQLPVVNGQRVLGIFSHRSFARAVVAQSKKASPSKPFDPLSLTVGDSMTEVPRFARVTDLFTQWFDDLEKHDFLLVGDPARLQAIVTATDLVRYLYRVASPYVLVADCELSLRAIIRVVISELVIADYARQHLADSYRDGKTPTALRDMTLNDYIRIVTDGRWNHFEPVLGRNRDNTRSRLEKFRDLRNQLYHHRGDVTPEEHESLADDRAWLRAKLDIAENHHPTEGTT